MEGRRSRRSGRRPKAGALIILLALVLAALLTAPAAAASVSPTVIDNWKSGDASWVAASQGYDCGYKLDEWDPVAGMDGTYEVTCTCPDGDISFTITISNSNGYAFDWSSTYPISAVIVKAGRGANLFSYGSGATGDTELFGYRNKEISHVIFCFDELVEEPGPVM